MARALLCCALVVLLLGPLRGGAQTELSDQQFNQLTQRWHQTLDSVSDDLRDLTVVGDILAALRENIRIVEESAADVRGREEAAAAGQQALLDAIGPVPGDGARPEDAALAAERSLIEDRLSRSLGRAARASVVLARARDLLERTVEEQTAALLDAVQQRTVSPLAPSVVIAAGEQLVSRSGELRDLTRRWWLSSELLDPWSDAGAVLLAVVALALLVGLPLRHWLLARFGQDPGIEQPNATRRFTAAMAVTLAEAVLPALVIVGLQAALSLSSIVAAELRLAVGVVLAVARDTIPLMGLAYAVLAPYRPQWRISRLTDEAAVHLFRAICGFALALFVIAPCLVALNPMYAYGRLFELIGFRNELRVLGGSLAVILFGPVMLNLVRRRNWRSRPEGVDEDGAEQTVGGPLVHAAMVLNAAVVIASMILCALGFVNLGIFAITSMTSTLVLLGYAVGLRLLILQGLQVANSPENVLGRWLRHRLILDDDDAARLVFWVMLTVDVVGAVLVAGITMVIWGMPGALLDEATELAIDGVDVGGFQLSLVDIAVALGVLILLLTGVRLFQRFLSDRILVQTRLELGVRDALATGVSYVGYVLAALITFGVLGLDVSNVALIFGALSVGIGFGLQHVVSNFVSGLILLVQRPIKTGDWIVVGDQQGYVRRISVTSTEIQTFDAAAVIIPNSTMLSNQVINWHLHNKLGRVIVPVGVSYDSDPEQVREVLLACADQNADVLKRPAPQVLFLNFGDSSLDFELRFFLREIDGLLRVSSEMRFAIQKAFGEAGIQIPYPQRDVHIRSTAPSPDRDPQGEIC